MAYKYFIDPSTNEIIQGEVTSESGGVTILSRMYPPVLSRADRLYLKDAQYEISTSDTFESFAAALAAWDGDTIPSTLRRQLNGPEYKINFNQDDTTEDFQNSIESGVMLLQSDEDDYYFVGFSSIDSNGGTELPNILAGMGEGDYLTVGNPEEFASFIVTEDVQATTAENGYYVYLQLSSGDPELISNGPIIIGYTPSGSVNEKGATFWSSESNLPSPISPVELAAVVGGGGGGPTITATNYGSGSFVFQSSEYTFPQIIVVPEGTTVEAEITFTASINNSDNFRIFLERTSGSAEVETHDVQIYNWNAGIPDYTPIGGGLFGAIVTDDLGGLVFVKIKLISSSAGGAIYSIKLNPFAVNIEFQASNLVIVTKNYT